MFNKNGDKKEKNAKNYMCEGISFGMMCGVTFGIIFKNLPISIGVGMSMGAAIGLCIRKKKVE